MSMVEYLKQIYMTKSTNSSALVAKLNDVATKYMMSEYVVLCEDGPCEVLYTDKYYCSCKMSICVPVSKQAIRLNSVDNDFICKVIKKRLFTYCPHCFEVPPMRCSLDTEKLASTRLIPLKAKKIKIVNSLLKMVISWARSCPSKVTGSQLFWGAHVLMMNVMIILRVTYVPVVKSCERIRVMV